jgi:nicotinamidase-related amidase
MKKVLLLVASVTLFGQQVTVSLRSRVEPYKGSGEWREVQLRQSLDPKKTAMVVCDVWDKHWCQGANRRVAEMAPGIDRLITVARGRGVLIIHAPSGTMEFYKNAPQRQAILAIPTAAAPPPIELASPALPIDDSDGGCDTPGDRTHKAWSRELAAIRIAGSDLVSDNGAEIYSAFRARGITHMVLMGVHANMCILNRSFAIKQMTRWGIRCILVRDLTDAMYNPQKAPHVSHAKGTELVIQHIEKHWCPTVLSADLIRALSN